MFIEPGPVAGGVLLIMSRIEVKKNSLSSTPRSGWLCGGRVRFPGIAPGPEADSIDEEEEGSSEKVRLGIAELSSVGELYENVIGFRLGWGCGCCCCCRSC